MEKISTLDFLKSLETLPIEINGKLQIWFKLSNLYELLSSKDIEKFAFFKNNFNRLPLQVRAAYTAKNYKESQIFLEKITAKLKGNFESLIVQKCIFGDYFEKPTRYYKIEDFNEIVNMILQENLVYTNLSFAPTINQSEIKSFISSFASKNVETLETKILEESIVSELAMK